LPTIESQKIVQTTFVAFAITMEGQKLLKQQFDFPFEKNN